MVTVGIPVYKARETLPKTLDSLVAQTTNDFIVILAQDGDGLDYSDIINEYMRRGLKIILIPSIENRGPGLTRQAILDAVTTDYVVFCDADDFLLPRAIERLSQAISENNYDIVKADYWREQEDGSVVLERSGEVAITWFHGVIYSMKYIKEKHLRFSNAFMYNEDAYFNVIAFNCTEKKGSLHEPLAIWRYNHNSVTRTDYVEFSKKHTYGYMVSQVNGLFEIYDRMDELDPAFVAHTLNNIYEAHQIIQYFGNEEHYVAGLNLIKKLSDCKGIADATNTPEFWYALSKVSKGCKFCGTHLIFFKMPFNTWLGLCNQETADENSDR